MTKQKTIISDAENILNESTLTEKNKIFCREYILDWNGSRAYKIAYPNVVDATARSNASDLLTNTNIQEYIKEIQIDLEKTAGISRLMVINEHMKLAFNSIAGLHNTWIKRKDFEDLTEDQKACIAEIDTKIKTEYEYNPETEKREPIGVEYVRIKLYDKQKALDSISKMLGYDAPTEQVVKQTIEYINVSKQFPNR
jgi:phage terminase small subunit